MTVNIAAIDDTVLALYLTLHDRDRAWKTFDWDALRRLYVQGMNDDSFNEVKSVLTEEGLRKSERLSSSNTLRLLEARALTKKVHDCAGSWYYTVKQ